MQDINADSKKKKTDLGNTALRAFHVSGGRGDIKIRNIFAPPLEKFCRCFLHFWCCVGLEKVDDKFIELLVTEAIIMAHPVGGETERQREMHTGATAYVIARGMTIPSIHVSLHYMYVLERLYRWICPLRHTIVRPTGVA